MEKTPHQFGTTRSSAPDVVRFLDTEIRPEAGFSVRDEFPAVFGDYPGGHSLYVEAQGRIIAHTAYLVRQFQHPLFHFKVGLIGSVITARAYRGHGFASALLRGALVELKKSGCLFSILWAENADFYRPLGFERAGREQLLRFSPAQIRGEDITEPVCVFDPKRHAEGVWRIYRQIPVTVDRSLQEFKSLCRIPNAQIYLTTASELVTSYLVIHKGLDFENTIHEWGGRMEGVRASIAHVQKNIHPGKELTLIAPADFDLKVLRTQATKHSFGVLGMVKLLDRFRLRAVYNDFLKASGRKTWMGVEWGGDGRSVPTKTDSDFIRAVLGDESPSEHPTLPFFLWGLDSI